VVRRTCAKAVMDWPTACWWSAVAAEPAAVSIDMPPPAAEEREAAARAALGATAVEATAVTGAAVEGRAARRMLADPVGSAATATTTAATQAPTECSSTAEPAVRAAGTTVQVPEVVVAEEATTAAEAAVPAPRLKAIALSAVAASPLLVISLYAKRNYVSHVQHESVSVLRFAEDLFGLEPLAGADMRATSPGPDCFNFSQKPRPFVPISS